MTFLLKICLINLRSQFLTFFLVLKKTITGENQIVIVSGANEKITVKDVLEVKQVIETSYVLTCTMEIPLECTIEALKIKSASNKGEL